MKMQCPNCCDALWIWERLPAGDRLICRACGIEFAVRNAQTNTNFIYVDAVHTIGTPDTAANLGIEEKEST